MRINFGPTVAKQQLSELLCASHSTMSTKYEETRGICFSNQPMVVTSLMKLYFEYKPSDKCGVLERLGLRPEDGVKCSRQDTSYDFHDHALLMNDIRLWVVQRTNLQTKSVSSLFKCISNVVQSPVHPNQLKIDQLVASDDALIRALQQRSNCPLKNVKLFTQGLLTHVYADIVVVREQFVIPLAQNVTKCSITFDACTSDFYPGTYYIGTLQFKNTREKTMHDCMALLPPRFQTITKNTGYVDTKVMHSLLFTNPFLYSYIRYGKSPVRTTLTQVAAIEDGIYRMSFAIGQQRQKLLPNSKVIAAGIKKLRQLRVMQHIAHQDLRAAQHVIPLAHHLLNIQRICFDEHWDNAWAEHYAKVCAHRSSVFSS